MSRTGAGSTSPANTMSDLRSIVYVSTAVAPFSDEELEALLQSWDMGIARPTQS